MFGGTASAGGCFQYQAACYTPQAFRTAYGIQALWDHGINGRGQTVVLPELATQPPASPPGVSDIRQDLARFDSLNHIPAAKLRVVRSCWPPGAPAWR